MAGIQIDNDLNLNGARLLWALAFFIGNLHAGTNVAINQNRTTEERKGLKLNECASYIPFGKETKAFLNKFKC